MEECKCPVCGSKNISENSELIKVESGDWGICRDCHHLIRLEVLNNKENNER
jgi:RNA polymerase subunit RPABC4/transcription elongation factor Spt4